MSYPGLLGLIAQGWNAQPTSPTPPISPPPDAGPDPAVPTPQYLGYVPRGSGLPYGLIEPVQVPAGPAAGVGNVGAVGVSGTSNMFPAATVQPDLPQPAFSPSDLRAIAGDMSLPAARPAPVRVGASRIGGPGWPDDVVHKIGTSAAATPSNAVNAALQCIVGQSPGPFTVTATSDGTHDVNSAHYRGRAFDVTADPNLRAAIMQAAANCGVLYQQNEYQHPSANSSGGHIHFQLDPGLRGRTGPYYPKTP